MKQPAQDEAGVRCATAGEIDALAAVLARAFADDGMIDWLCGPRGHEPDDARNQRSAALFTGYLRFLAMPHGMVYTADGLPGAALWSPPGKWKMGLVAQARMTPCFIRATGLAGLPTRFLGAEKVLAAHPHEPHYYLQVLGVDPAHQGTGWGGRFLRKGLQVADSKGFPCFLETMNPDNIGYYNRHGFRVTGELRLPWTGHPLWLMWRERSEPAP